MLTTRYTVLVSPNPFNPRTKIRFDLAQAGPTVRLELYDQRGQRVRTLAAGWHEVGLHALTWDGRDDHGHAVGSGLYLVRLAEREAVRTGKALLVR